jgi:hypothetical protein
MLHTIFMRWWRPAMSRSAVAAPFTVNAGPASFIPGASATISCDSAWLG